MLPRRLWQNEAYPRTTGKLRGADIYTSHMVPLNMTRAPGTRPPSFWPPGVRRVESGATGVRVEPIDGVPRVLTEPERAGVLNHKESQRRGVRNSTGRVPGPHSLTLAPPAAGQPSERV